ncbi:efflux RND transporter periplasmic adaptor subunit [Pedomonas sp. V897]|uniref:efflux RND transporter periplasmic adaptor subunit n=1 Tax=Pedomonas sp. V897 TaxID=3446482 RepID=UPI003EE32C2E
MTSWRLRPFVLTAALTLPLLAACGQEQAQAPALPEVGVANPLIKTVQEWDEFSGRFESIDYVEVRARVSGYLQSIHFTDGQYVRKGDLLFVIDPRPFQVELERAQAELKEAEAQLRFATNNVERARRLLENRNVSEQLYDQRVQERDQARAAVDRAKAAVREAELNLTYTRVTAPVSGRISARAVSIGNLVTGGSNDSTLLTSIASLDPIYFVFDGDEATYLDYLGAAQKAKGRPLPVELQLMGESGFPHKGQMDFVDNQIDPQTGTIRGRAVVPNPDHVFVPGMFAKMRLLRADSHEAVLVPDEALATDQADRVVYVVDKDGAVAQRKVALGPIIDGLRVIRDGLEPTDKVVVEGLMRVRPGATVKPRPATITPRPDGETTTAAATPATAPAGAGTTGAAK